MAVVNGRETPVDGAATAADWLLRVPTQTREPQAGVLQALSRAVTVKRRARIVDGKAAIGNPQAGADRRRAATNNPIARGILAVCAIAR
jgi:hypothetical protein